MRIKDFIANRWVAYADYDNQRSLPHLMDGLKITQRKALYAATKLPKNSKPIKVSQFAAKAAELTAYHHGDASMISTIVGLAQDYPGSNNYPLLRKHGQFGSRLSNEAAAARYISIQLHDNWHVLFPEQSQEPLEILQDDGEPIEPKYFIPVVPVLLLNGCDGVGNGFRSKILNYDIKSIINAIFEIINNGDVLTPLVPSITGWHGTINKIDRRVIFTGVITKVNKGKLLISELPPIYDNDKFKKILNKLIDDKFIKNYQNKSTEDKWEWVIDCPRETSALPHDVLLDKFGLIARVSENFVCWGCDGNAPQTFETAEDLLKCWYHSRLLIYQTAITRRIKRQQEIIIAADIKMKFIEWCLANDFRALSRDEFIHRISTEIPGMIPTRATELVATPMYKITTDEVRKLEHEIRAQFDLLDRLTATTPLNAMVCRLNAVQRAVRNNS